MDYKKLRQFRLAASLSQIIISDKLNMSQNSYSLVESGKTNMPIERYLLVAEILNVKPPELLTDKELELYHVLSGTNIDIIGHESKFKQYEEKIKYLAKILEIKDTEIEALKLQIRQLNKDAKKHNDLDKF